MLKLFRSYGKSIIFAFLFREDLSLHLLWLITFSFSIYICSAIWHLSKCRSDAINAEMNWLGTLKQGKSCKDVKK